MNYSLLLTTELPFLLNYAVTTALLLVATYRRMLSAYCTGVTLRKPILGIGGPRMSSWRQLDIRSSEFTELISPRQVLAITQLKQDKNQPTFRPSGIPKPLWLQYSPLSPTPSLEMRRTTPISPLGN